jgi:hypothetical protein
MIPTQDLLSRIRWDEDFGRARFEIAYYDRVEKKVIPRAGAAVAARARHILPGCNRHGRYGAQRSAASSARRVARRRTNMGAQAAATANRQNQVQAIG